MGCGAMVFSNKGQMPAIVSSNQDQAAHDPALRSQGSVYGFTLDEMQNHISGIGKPVYAMKSEKMSNNPASAEQQQNHVQSSYATSSTNNGHRLRGNLCVNGTLCRKAMKEVWGEYVALQDEQSDSHGTLEDLVAGAGAVNYESQGDVLVMDPPPFMGAVLDPMVDPMVQQHADLLHYQLAATQQTQQQKKMPVFETNIPMFNDAVVGDYTENKQKGASIMPVVPMAMVKPTLADTQAAGMLEVKQSDGPLDKNYERKQKRMIKNRESAARSRAKKQAYIIKLEKEVIELKQANACLKRQNEVDSLMRNSTPPPKRACQLRRTRSSEL